MVPLALLVAWSPVCGQSRAESQKSSEEVKQSVGELTTKVSRAVAEIRLGERTVALGTIIDKQGLLVTKASEIQGEGSLSCRLWDQRQFAPEIVAEDESLDLALLRLPVDELDAIDLSNDRHPTAGSFLVSVGASGETIGLSVAETDARKFNLRHARQSRRAHLGVTCSSIQDDGGLLVRQVTPDSAARRAGIREGDVIVSIDDRQLTVVEQLVRELRRFDIGDEVELVVRRGEERVSLQAKLGAPPSFEVTDQWGGGPFSKRRFGFETVIVHDAPLAPHQCGGPLLDTDGRVVGINIARALRVASYAHPTASVREFVRAQRADPNGAPASNN
jgi:serine protease Do